VAQQGGQEQADGGDAHWFRFDRAAAPPAEEVQVAVVGAMRPGSVAAGLRFIPKRRGWLSDKGGGRPVNTRKPSHCNRSEDCYNM
jgi:hypothetical protein